MISKYISYGACLIAVIAVSIAGWQSSRLAETRAELTTTKSDLADAEASLVLSEARRRGAESAHRETLEELAAERAAADAAARTVADLRDRIARDAGTDRDAPTAPVLSDTIRDLGGKIRTRPDDGFLGRRKVWRLVVFIAGKPTNIIEVADQAACIGAAGAAADAVRKLPNYEAELKGKVVISCARTTPGVSA